LNSQKSFWISYRNEIDLLRFRSVWRTSSIPNHYITLHFKLSLHKYDSDNEEVSNTINNTSSFSYLSKRSYFLIYLTRLESILTVSCLFRLCYDSSSFICIYFEIFFVVHKSCLHYFSFRSRKSIY
jgi:hypothetical protein